MTSNSVKHSLKLALCLQTYYGFDPMSLEDEVDRTAAAAMVRTYGQAPRQLLRQPHPHAAHDLTTRAPHRQVTAAHTQTYAHV